MSDKLIKHLKEKTEDHSALRSMYSQWDFDEKLIPKALQTVGILFPHYSRHDESHSKQILVNIERLLGDNIKLLTATDTWLLLEAAYWHDIGMVVPHADLEIAQNDERFQNFIDSLCNQPHHELNEVARLFKQQPDASVVFLGKSPMEMLSGFRELMAEWFRQIHPSRSEKIVNSPKEMAGIGSPRTELIPARLFSVLGKICRMHGAHFSSLLAVDGLPFREAGMAQDDCHPRFVACMLRMGDLLDLDDNRFCPVMQRISGDQRPAITRAHEDKHAGMRHLRIDQQRIAVTAECQTIEGYLEAFRWFDWLKQEVQDQMAHWQDIVPSRELGLLPTLGPVTVRLAGNLQLLKEGERPAFSLDAKQAIELLQGNNLYESKYACIRELLQNAVDATLLRIWLVNKGRLDPSEWRTPDGDGVKLLFENYSISIKISEDVSQSSASQEKSTWTVQVRDDGTGISRSDLEYMLQIGGSQRNTYRQKEIALMPEWMKPSGAFGIGLQSIFMLCDEVEISTKNIWNNEILNIKMFSPTGAKDGLVVLRRLPEDVSTNYGTTFKFSFELDKFAQSWSIPYQDDGSIAYRLVTELDPLLDDSFPFEAAQLADQAAAFQKNSLLPIKGSFVSRQNSIDFDSGLLNESSGAAWRYVKTDIAEVRIKFIPMPGRHSTQSLLAFYRGQKFEVKGVYFPHVSIQIDIMSGKAGSWLNFNRDKISSRAVKDFEALVNSALELAVEEDLTGARLKSTAALGSEAKAVYSLFLKAMALCHEGKWIELSNKLGDAWLKMPTKAPGKNLGDYFGRDEWTLGRASPSDEIEPPDCDLVLSEEYNDFTIGTLISEWLKKPGRMVQIVGSPHVYDFSRLFVGPETPMSRINRSQKNSVFYRNRYHFKNELGALYDNPALAYALAERIANSPGNRRFLLPVTGEFEILSLAPGNKLLAQYLFPINSPSENYAVLPFLFVAEPQGGVTVQASSAQLDALCNWVLPRLKQPAPFADVKRSYENFINFVDLEIMRPTIFWPRWHTARGLRTDGTRVEKI